MLNFMEYQRQNEVDAPSHAQNGLRYSLQQQSLFSVTGTDLPMDRLIF
jgi:hypothetical protein